MLNAILCSKSDLDGIRSFLSEPAASDIPENQPPIAGAGLNLTDLGELVLIRFDTKLAVSDWFSRRIAWNTPNAMMYESTDGTRVYDHIRERYIEGDHIVLFSNESGSYLYRDLDAQEAAEAMRIDFSREEELIGQDAIPVDDDDLR